MSNFCLTSFIFFIKSFSIFYESACYYGILFCSILERKDTETEDAAVLLANSSPQKKLDVPLQPSGSPAEISERPAPHEVSEEEMNLVRTCLQRWRNEIEQDVQGWP